MNGLNTRGLESEKILILVHGGPGLSDEYFAKSLSDVTQKYQVVSYSQGSVLQKQENIEDLTNELIFVINKFEDKKCQIFLLGHSGGAALILHTLEKIQKFFPLILISWIWDMYWVQIFTEKFKQADQCMKTLNHLNLSAVDANERLRNNLIAYAPAYFHANHVQKGIEMFKNLSVNGLLYEKLQNTWLNQLDYSAFLSTLDGKQILSLSGDSDAVTSPEYFTDLKFLNKKIKHNIIPNSGHFPFIEKDKQVSQMILDFMKKIKPKKSA